MTLGKQSVGAVSLKDVLEFKLFFFWPLTNHALGNLRTTTAASLTKTGSELQCTAQARLVNFVIVVSSTTPNIVESRRPAIHKLRQV